MYVTKHTYKLISAKVGNTNTFWLVRKLQNGKENIIFVRLFILMAEHIQQNASECT